MNTNIESINNKTVFPTWTEIERYNNKQVYSGLELKFLIIDGLCLRISVQNEQCIFNYKTDNIIYMSLCTLNDFPIYRVSYKYCEDGYWSAIRDIYIYTQNLIKSLPMFSDFLKSSLSYIESKS